MSQLYTSRILSFLWFERRKGQTSRSDVTLKTSSNSHITPRLLNRQIPLTTWVSGADRHVLHLKAETLSPSQWLRAQVQGEDRPLQDCQTRPNTIETALVSAHPHHGILSINSIFVTSSASLSWGQGWGGRGVKVYLGYKSFRQMDSWAVFQFIFLKRNF